MKKRAYARMVAAVTAGVLATAAPGVAYADVATGSAALTVAGGLLLAIAFVMVLAVVGVIMVIVSVIRKNRARGALPPDVPPDVSSEEERQ